MAIKILSIRIKFFNALQKSTRILYSTKSSVPLNAFYTSKSKNTCVKMYSDKSKK